MNLLDMNLPMLLDESTSGRLCLTLLHSLWQVALLAALVWVIGRRSSVERGYALHVAALFLALAALPITYALLPAPVTPAIEVATPMAEPELPMVNPAPVADISLPDLPEPAVPIEPAVVAIDAEPVVAIAEPEPASSRWVAAAPWIVAIYALGVALMLLRLAVGSAKAHALCRRARKIVDGPLVDLLSRLAREWSLRARCRLAESTEVVVPQVIGLLRPTILLPAAAITGLAPRDLEMILVHELAHIRRHDVWVNFVQRLAEAILFFNPGLWYLSRRIGTLREYCCDELACRDMPGDTLPPRVEYATALLNVVELAKPGARTRELGALAASGRGPSELRRRVARLFGEPLREPLRLSRGGVLAAVGMAVVLLVGPAWMGTRAQSPAEESQAEEAEQREPVLRGRVVDEQGEPLPGVKIVLYGGADTRFREQDTATDDNGGYEFDPLTSGMVSRSRGKPTALLVGVVFEHETHVPADGISWRDVTINLETGKEAVETLDLNMVPGGRVSGIVRHAESGEPMPKLSLRLYNGLPDENDATYHEYVTTDEIGQFATAALFPGRYIIDINDNDFEGDRKYPKIGLTEVKAGETTSVELTTRDLPQLQDPSTINGAAPGTGGVLNGYDGVGPQFGGRGRLIEHPKDASGETVKLDPVDGRGKRLADVQISNVWSSGELHVAEPGTEELDIVGLQPNEKRPVIILHQPSRLAKIVRLSAEDSGDSPHSVTLEPCGSVVVKLVDGEGTVPHAGVIASHIPLGFWVEMAFADDAGNVELKYLPPGASYKLFVLHREYDSVVLVDRIEVKTGERIDLGTIDVTSEERPEPLRSEAGDDEVEASADPEESAQEAITIIGDKFVVTPVTTPLERSLLGSVERPAAGATTCVLVNTNAFDVNDAIDLEAAEWQQLAERLKSAEAGAENVLYVRVLESMRDDLTYEQRRQRSDDVAKAVEQLATRETRFGSIQTTQTFGNAPPQLA